MGDILDQVLKAEEAANRVLDEAKKQAADLKRAASDEASEAQEGARGRAHEILEDRLETARREAELAYEQSVHEAEEADGEFMRAKRQSLDRIVEEVVEFVVTPEHRRGE